MPGVKNGTKRGTPCVRAHRLYEPAGPRPATGVRRQGSGNCVLRCLNSGIHAVACPGVELAGIHASHPAGLILRRAPLLEGDEKLHTQASSSITRACSS